MGWEKPDLRAAVLSARRETPAQVRAMAGASIGAFVVQLPEMAGAHTVATYLSVGTEPPTRDLVRELAARGVRVLTPVLLPDSDLGWTAYDEDAGLTGASHGLEESRGQALGCDAVADADLVIVPALAVDRRGNRLGRGGGSYDRALARVSSTTPVVALVYDDEVVDGVPTEPHDRRVDVAVTPSRVWRF